jgi:hypothetical protein
VDTRAIAELWRRQCVSPDIWLEAESQAGALPGSCDGIYLVSDAIGWRRVYVKPLRRGQIRGRAAREKIAADLAFELGVPVPPSVLIERHDAGGSFERYANASLVVYQGQAPWWAVRRAVNHPGRSALRELARRTMVRDSAAAFAFDTWVGQTEHQPDHPHNIILGWSGESESGFGFLDYEYAFGGLDDSWRGDRTLDCHAAPFPEELFEALDRSDLESPLGAIEAIPTEIIEDVVHRIPAEFLDEADRDRIARGLIARQALVRPAIWHTLGRET